MNVLDARRAHVFTDLTLYLSAFRWRSTDYTYIVIGILQGKQRQELQLQNSDVGSEKTNNGRILPRKLEVAEVHVQPRHRIIIEASGCQERIKVHAF